MFFQQPSCCISMTVKRKVWNPDGFPQHFLPLLFMPNNRTSLLEVIHPHLSESWFFAKHTMGENRISRFFRMHTIITTSLGQPNEPRTRSRLIVRTARSFGGSVSAYDARNVEAPLVDNHTVRINSV